MSNTNTRRNRKRKIKKLCEHGELMLMTGRLDQAIIAFTEAMNLKVFDYRIIESINYCYLHFIPAWHFCMLNDSVRNQNYAESIKSSVDQSIPERILDLGCGCGLLTLAALEYAHRDSKVTAIDINNLFADITEELINRMNYEDRVVVKHESSFSFLSSEPFDLLITELFDCSLFGEQILSVLNDLYTRKVIHPGGKIIPHSANLHIGVYQCNEIGHKLDLQKENYTSYPLDVLLKDRCLKELALQYNVVMTICELWLHNIFEIRHTLSFFIHTIGNII